jgi:hypothetical protein
MSGGGGDYLDNDTLISNQLVFDIVDVIDDRNGGFNGNDRWMVKVEPHYEGEDDPIGLITLNDNPARRKFMLVIQSELDALEKSGGEVFIGPCCLVRLKGRNYRYIEIVDWDKEQNKPILPDGAVLAGAGGDETRTRRTPRSGADVAAPSNDAAAANDTSTRSRSFAPADGGNAAASRSAVVPASAPVAAPAVVPVPAPVPVPAVDNRIPDAAPAPDFPTVKEWARSQGIEVADRGRVKREIAEAYERAKAAALGTGDYAAPAPEVESRSRQRRVTAQAEAPPEPHTRPAQVGAGAPAKAGRPPQGGAPSAREMVWSPGTTGSTTCPICNELVHDRVFPKGDGSGYSIVHRCQTGEMQTLDAVLDEAAG